MNRYLLASLAFLLPSLAAQEQEAPATQDPKAEGIARLDQPMARVYADGVQELRKQWPKSRLGQLLADPDVAEAAAAVRNYTANNLKRQRATMAEAHALGEALELEPWIASTLYRSSEDEIWSMFRHPVEEVTRAEIVVAMVSDPRVREPLMATFLSCRPRFEGRWTQAFEGEVERLRRSKYLKEVPDSKVDGFPAYSFGARTAPETDQFLGGRNIGRWYLHMPGTFVYGSGKLPNNTKIDTNPSPRPPGIGMRMDFEQYTDMFERVGIGIPEEFQLMGFHKIRELTWSGKFVGELLQDEFTIELGDNPTGLLAALLTGTAKLPAQALPKGAIAQVRAAVNFDSFEDVLPMLASEMGIDAEEANKMLKVFDGGISAVSYTHLTLPTSDLV